MRGSDFNELKAFSAIVEEGSFVRAAARLQVSPPALSQTIRQLEARVGVRLLNRTTRSVSPTAAGEKLFGRLAGVFEELDGALAEVQSGRDRPAGTLRINASRVAAMRFIAPVLGDFQLAYPDIALTVVVDDMLTDIVERRFDAGIRLGERLEQDMVAVKLSDELQIAAVAAPAYLAGRAVPRHPKDLHKHRCINFQWPGAGDIYRWEFSRGRRSLEIALKGNLIVNDTEFMIRGRRGLYDRLSGPALDRKGQARPLSRSLVPPFSRLLSISPKPTACSAGATRVHRFRAVEAIGVYQPIIVTKLSNFSIPNGLG